MPPGCECVCPYLVALVVFLVLDGLGGALGLQALS